MGAAGTDVALETSDVALMQDDLPKLAEAKPAEVAQGDRAKVTVRDYGIGIDEIDRMLQSPADFFSPDVHLPAAACWLDAGNGRKNHIALDGAVAPFRSVVVRGIELVSAVSTAKPTDRAATAAHASV